MNMFTIDTVSEAHYVNGTSLQGCVNVDYSTLVNVFGEPEGFFDNYKSDCAWTLEINGTICTIYNYKDGRNYLADNGLDKENITDWHVGGKSIRSYLLVEHAIKHYLNMQTA
jgi:hypothetical protein